MAAKNPNSSAPTSGSPDKENGLYISYSPEDGDWVNSELLSKLKRAGFRVLLDHYSKEIGTAPTSSLRENLASIRIILPIFSPTYFSNKRLTGDLTFALATAAKNETLAILPILYRKCAVPTRYQNLSVIDFSGFDFSGTNKAAKSLLQAGWNQLIQEIRDLINQKNSESQKPYKAQPIPDDEEIDKLNSKPEKIAVKGRGITDTYSDRDLLGYSDYVDALVDLIKSDETQKPLVIGIDAPWGGGKTSLMRMLEKRILSLSNEERSSQEKRTTNLFTTVWFNAWKYDQEELLWAALVLEILQQVSKQIGFWRRCGLSLSLNWKRFDKQAFFTDLGKSLLFALVLTTVGYIAFVSLALFLGTTWIETWGWLRHYVKVLAGMSLMSLLYTGFKDVAGMLVSPFNLGISKYLRSPKYQDKVGFKGQFQNDFKNVVDAVTIGGKWPLVIFIDDLDRCTPGKAADVIEAINLLLDSKNCVFIIGMDEHVLASSIQAKYKELQGFFCDIDNPGGLGLGRKFLEKIIQIDFHVPRPDEKHVFGFIDVNLGSVPPPTPKRSVPSSAEEMLMAEQRGGKSLDEARIAVEKSEPGLANQIPEAIKAIIERSFDDASEVCDTVRAAAPYLGFNPRKIKRFINLFRLQALIAYRRGVLEKPIKLDRLGIWTLVNMRWPEIVEQAAVKPEFAQNFFGLADKYIRATATAKKKILEGIMDPILMQDQIKQLLGNQELHQLLGKVSLSPVEVAIYLKLTQVSSATIQ